MKKTVIYILMSFLISSCEYIDNLTTTSPIITQTYQVYNINTFTVECACKIKLLNSESAEILITGQEHLVNDLIIESTNNNLTIDHKKRDYLQKSKLIEIQIPAAKIQNITVNSVMTLVNEEALTNNLNIVVNGTAKFTEMDLNLNNSSTSLSVFGFNNSGNYSIYGHTNSFKANIEGTVNLYTDDFISEKVNLNHKSIGRCNVNVLDELYVNTYSSGNTYYHGEPDNISFQQIQLSNIEPTGKLIKF
nr:DUF2807 domain-containing protein [uncultured Carboxylicivirga sp.]